MQRQEIKSVQAVTVCDSLRFDGPLADTYCVRSINLLKPNTHRRRRCRRDATVELTQLTYFRYRGMVSGSRDWQPSNGTIWLDDVRCVGHETSIADCTHAGWGIHNCVHSEDVSVSCGTSPVRYGNFNCSSVNHFMIFGCLGHRCNKRFFTFFYSGHSFFYVFNVF